MWQPLERIKHERPAATWPAADEAARARLFQPLAIGPRIAETRTWVPAMVPWRATDDGFVTPDVLDWYRRFAQGRPGVLVVEATGIRDIPSGPLLRIGHDRFVEGLTSLVRAVREASEGHTLLLIQLIDFLAIRRRPERDKYLARFLAITDLHREKLAVVASDATARTCSEAELRARLIALADQDLQYVLSDRECEDLERGYRERVTDTQLPHIADLPRVLPGLFADAAGRALAAGFDGVELHFAHAYTMASFISALNTRACARAARSLGQPRPVSSHRYSPIAIDSQMVSAPCLSTGTRPAGLYWAIRLRVSGCDSAICTSSNARPRCRSSIHGRSDQEE